MKSAIFCWSLFTGEKWWIYHFWARFWPYFNFVDFRAYFGPFSLVNRDQQKMADFIMKMASNKKMQENKPTLKFNFTIEKRWGVSKFSFWHSHWALIHNSQKKCKWKEKQGGIFPESQFSLWMRPITTIFCPIPSHYFFSSNFFPFPRFVGDIYQIWKLFLIYVYIAQKITFVCLIDWCLSWSLVRIIIMKMTFVHWCQFHFLAFLW